jgi:hypothetical protein
MVTDETRQDETLYRTYSPERYLGTLNPIENELWERDSHHDIILTPAPGRIIVNIKDPDNYLGDSETDKPYVIVEGPMSKMNLGEPRHERLGRKGFGEKISVRSNIHKISPDVRAEESEYTHTTDIFGVLPSEDNKPLRVHIWKGDEHLQTLTINAENTGGVFTALHSGDLLVFDYDLTEPQFSVNIVPYTIKIVNTPL